MKRRLDIELNARGLVPTRSQAESWIKLGKVTVDGKQVTKPGFFVSPNSSIELEAEGRYVSRAGLKLASVANVLNLDFKDKIVLDVGSSTGGFTDYALQNGAKKVYAVDVGSEQLHQSLRGNSKIELYERTDIRWVAVEGRPLPSSQISGKSARRSLDAGPSTPFASSLEATSSGTAPSSHTESLDESLQSAELAALKQSSTGQDSSKDSAGLRRVASEVVSKDNHLIGNLPTHANVELGVAPDIIVIDVSFISLREILPHTAEYIASDKTQIIAMVKPQFEAGKSQTNKGVIKNDSVRRGILKDFENWAKSLFVIVDKRDSDVAGAKGNQERFYHLKLSTKR